MHVMPRRPPSDRYMARANAARIETLPLVRLVQYEHLSESRK